MVAMMVLSLLCLRCLLLRLVSGVENKKQPYVENRKTLLGRLDPPCTPSGHPPAYGVTSLTEQGYVRVCVKRRCVMQGGLTPISTANICFVHLRRYSHGYRAKLAAARSPIRRTRRSTVDQSASHDRRSTGRTRKLLQYAVFTPDVLTLARWSSIPGSPRRSTVK